MRQLESMIRLSEAMSRMYCSDEVRHEYAVLVWEQNLCFLCSPSLPPPPQVQPKHVKEAFRLLNKSIIRVETPDIDFEEEQQLLEG